MPDDARTVPITLEIDAQVAPALEDALTRSLAARLVSRMLEPASLGHLFKVMDAISAEARDAGLTEEMLEVELAAHNAQGRERSIRE